MSTLVDSKNKKIKLKAHLILTHRPYNNAKMMIHIFESKLVDLVRPGIALLWWHINLTSGHVRLDKSVQ